MTLFAILLLLAIASWSDRNFRNAAATCAAVLLIGRLLDGDALGLWFFAAAAAGELVIGAASLRWRTPAAGAIIPLMFLNLSLHLWSACEAFEGIYGPLRAAHAWLMPFTEAAQALSFIILSPPTLAIIDWLLGSKKQEDVRRWIAKHSN